MKYIYLSFFIFATYFSFGQNFEGTLIYSNNLELSEKFVETTGMTKEKMKASNSFCEHSKITYKDSNYLSEPIKGSIKLIYSPQRNEILTIDKKLDLVSAILANVDLELKKTGTLPKIEIQDTEEIILSQKCKKVVVTWKSGIYEYYYNSEFLKMDSSLYSNHIYDMWFEFLKISNALPLKIVKKMNGLMTITMTLIEVKEHSVNDRRFKLPKLKPHEELVITKGNQRYYTKD